MSDQDEISDVFIDESSQTKHRFLVLGGIIVPTPRTDSFAAELMAARLPELPKGEAKWGKVSRTKLGAYRRMVDFFFDHIVAAGCHFHSLVVDTTKLDHGRFNDGNREIGFNKEVYQLATKFGRLYPGLFHVYPDHRETSQKPEELRLILNRGMRKEGDQRDWPYRRCHFRKSDECLPLQLVDVFIGAVAYNLNHHHEALDASPAKIELMNHILCRGGITNPNYDTNRRGKFTIWHRRLR